MKLLDDHELESVEKHLLAVLDRVLSAEGMEPFNQSLRAFVLGGGKRVRPQLCLWTYARAGGHGSHGPALMDIACVWEIFHAFLLAHDDIIDHSDSRRARPSLHKQLADLDGQCPIFGSNLGIVAGDLLFGISMRILHEMDLPLDLYKQVLKLFSRVACTTGYGQAMDIIQTRSSLDSLAEETLLREYHWKTAAYTFEGPMLSGAILARADEAAQRAISTYALALGQAYQLHNDLIDLSAPVHEGCDIVQGKRTLTLLRGRAAMPDGARREFDRRFETLPAAGGAMLHTAEALRQELRAVGALKMTADRIDQFLAEARAAARQACLSPSLRAGLEDLLNSLDAKYFRGAGAPPA